MTELIRVGFDPGTVERFAAVIAARVEEESERVTRSLALKAERLLEAEINDLTQDAFRDPTGAYVGSIVGKVEKTPDGYRAYLTVEGDESDIVKARIIEYGRDAKFIYPVTRRAMKWDDAGRSKFDSGPNKGKVFAKRVKLRPVPGKRLLRRARDRVYQRIRRGAV